MRLAALWGDLTAAFGLPARDAAGEEDATWPVALRASKESVKSMARCLDGSETAVWVSLSLWSHITGSKKLPQSSTIPVPNSLTPSPL